ncbi:MAG: NAD(P)/FAD-dependent oxidoreductase [Pseudolabrys sp.]
MDAIFERKKIPVGTGLDDLATEVRRDLARLNYPPRAWPFAAQTEAGSPVLDVLVVGGGMYGQTAAFALYREGIRNIRVIDRAPRGQEGPWGTYARMEILRSPKHQIGPDLGVASLTYRAWYEAQHGADSWNDVYKIHRLDWLAYLLWVRDTLDLPVENDCELVALTPAGNFIGAELNGKQGRETIVARHVILATGREGTGDRYVPDFPSFHSVQSDGHGRIFHSANDIDFEKFFGKRIAILGANASAFDNAGVSLESGAAEVTMFCRRPFLPQVNKARWMGFSGFQHGFPALDDASRWRFVTFTAAVQMPPPHESVLRCTRRKEFSLRFASPWQDVISGTDNVTVVTPKGREVFDAVIFGTGFAVDVSRRPELSAFRDFMMLWGDRVGPQEAARNPVLARFPYLGSGFEFREREAGLCPSLSHLHVISYGAAMSHGALAGDIPGLAPATVQVAQSISRAIFADDFDRYYEAMTQFEEPELEPTPFYVPPEQRPAPGK